MGGEDPGRSPMGAVDQPPPEVTRHRAASKTSQVIVPALLAAPERLQRAVRTSLTSGAWPCIRRGQVVAYMGLRTYSPGPSEAKARLLS